GARLRYRARRSLRGGRLRCPGLLLGLGLLLLLDALAALLIFLQLRAGIEHLPHQQHGHREHDGDKQVFLVVLVHERATFPVCRRLAYRSRAGARCTRSSALTRSDTIAPNADVSAGLRAIRT